MSPLSIGLVCAQCVIFAIWIFAIFRWLFALRRDAVAGSGVALPGPRRSLRAFRNGLSDKRYATDRLLVGLLTLALVALSLLHSVVR